MKVGVLTAALQELTPREVRDARSRPRHRGVGRVRPHPRRRLHPAVLGAAPDRNRRSSRGDARSGRQHAGSAEAVRQGPRAPRRGAARRSRIGLSDVGYFDNLLHHDPAIRKKKHDFMLRVFDAAALLGVNAVCGFVGRNQQRTMDENLLDFEQQFVPLLKEAKARGLTYRVEQCPMPGWTTGDNWHNNIAYTPGPWIALHRICEKHGVGDQFRIHYDPSHAILMGQDTRSIFQYLKDAGYNFLIGGFHVKGQVIDAKGVTAWGYGGQTMERGDWIDGKPSAEPGRSAERVEEAGGSVRARAARHGAPRSARLPAEPDGRLARSPARRARAAAARRGQHAPGRRARVPEGAHPGSRARHADPAGLDRVRPAHRRSRRVHVRAAERSPRGAGDSRPGRSGASRIDRDAGRETQRMRPGATQRAGVPPVLSLLRCWLVARADSSESARRSRRRHRRRAARAPAQAPPPPAGGRQGRGRGPGCSPRSSVLPAIRRSIARGKALYDVTCALCHGSDLRGGAVGGPNLLRSQLVLSDKAGEQILPIIRGARADKGMPPIAMPDDDVKAIAEYIHSMLALSPRQGMPPPGDTPPVLNILVGDAAAGATYFDGEVQHVPFGDRRSAGHRDASPRSQGAAEPLGVGRRRRRARRPRRGGAPRRRRAESARRHRRRSRCRRARRSKAGCCGSTTSSFADRWPTAPSAASRGAAPCPRSRCKDPLEPHRKLLTVYTDKDMHDVTAYLATLK